MLSIVVVHDFVASGAQTTLHAVPCTDKTLGLNFKQMILVNMHTVHTWFT